ncbi:MAG: GAF domain-containing protein [Ornithinimicrobium sp.]
MVEASAPADSPQVGGLLLLQAVRELSATDQDLEDVLARTVQIACQLTGARYGAMGVLAEAAPDRLSHFITHGLTQQERGAIGELPRAHGLLGRLLREPTGVRVRDVAQEHDAVGYPPGHPVMHSFLGMPIRTASGVFGNLYLTEKAGAPEFSAEDESVLETLAAVVGVVVDLSRRRLEARSQRTAVATVRTVNRALVTEQDPASVVSLVLTEALRTTGASAALVLKQAASNDADAWEVLAAEGDADVVDDVVTQVETQLREGTTRARPTHGARNAPRLLLDDQQGPRRTSIVPVALRDGTSLALVVRGWRPATSLAPRLTESLLESLGDQVGLILDRVAAAHHRDEITRLQDRERIARDLHDLVIQRIFAAGLTLQGAARLATPPEVTERVERTIAELDATIRDIRATIFALTPSTGGSLRSQIQDLMQSYAPHLGFAPTLHCPQPVEDLIDEEGRLSLLLVVREALSNVARHARATSVEIDVRAEADRLLVTVTDDGVGLPEAVVESGLGNARSRARQRGGSMDLLARTPRGTVLRWQVPLPD